MTSRLKQNGVAERFVGTLHFALLRRTFINLVADEPSAFAGKVTPSGRRGNTRIAVEIEHPG